MPRTCVICLLSLLVSTTAIGKCSEPCHEVFNETTLKTPGEPMNHIHTAKTLMAWIQAKLNAASDLKKEEIAEFYAPTFTVEANGRSYPANYDNYFDFLNQFRSDIKSIAHDVYRFYELGNTVVMTDRAKIVRVDEQVQQYEAVVILEFNNEGKIILWHEVYVEVPKLGSKPSGTHE